MDRDIVLGFVEEAREIVSGLEEDLTLSAFDPEDQGARQRCLFALHSLKGLSVLMGLDAVSQKAHELEDALQEPNGSAAEGPLSMLAQLDAEIERIALQHGLKLPDPEETPVPGQGIPLSELFEGLQHLVRSGRHHAQLQVACADEVWLSPLEAGTLRNALLQLILNSLHHGIEPTEDRLLKGKAATGVIQVNGQYEREWLSIIVEDDGRGLNPEEVKRKALERGILSPEAVDTLAPSRTLDLIFCEGFSSEKTSALRAGRGVGLAAVRAAVERLGGTIMVDSEPGRGTRFIIRLPRP